MAGGDDASATDASTGLAAPGTQDLILSKEGPGRLYYRLGLRYAPTDLDLDHLWVVYPGAAEYALDDGITAVPLEGIEGRL